MKQRNPIAVFLLGLVTCGIYSLYWAVKTKGEMNKMGEQIPTAWILLIPIIGAVWWFWKYSEGVGRITKENPSGIMAFILLFLLGSIGQAIIQDFFNKVTVEAPVLATTDPIVSSAPSPSFEVPAQEIPAKTVEAEAEPTYEPPQTPTEPSVPIQQPTPVSGDETPTDTSTTPFGPTPL